MRPVLMLVDYQKAFDNLAWGARNNPDAEANAAAVLAAFRSKNLPVIHIRHDSRSPGSSLGPGQPGNAFKAFAAPRDGEPIVPKSVNAAFIGTDLEERLRQLEADPVVIMGITTDHCVSTTTRMAKNLGFKPVLVGDACHTFGRKGFDADTVHRVELAILDREFADVVTAAELIGRLDAL
jgi:nicotinamidase-related amidase